MLLEDQISSFESNGHVTIPQLFTDAEVHALREEITLLSAQDIPQRLLEVDSNLVRAIYGVHELRPLLAKLIRDPRLVSAAQRLLRAEVYIHQTQVSPKMPLRGNLWEWHQDFLYWARDDGMPTSNVLSVGILLDEVTEFNGPMFVVDGSHEFNLDSITSTNGQGWERTSRDGNKYQIDTNTLTSLMSKSSLSALKGPAGSAVIFHGGLLHCSPPNLSGDSRTILFVRYNAINNQLRSVAQPRPTWVANRNPVVLTALDGPFLSIGDGHVGG